MIKNIVFDFGNVVIKWNVDELVGKYTNDEEEKRILKEIIFESEEWNSLDEGILSVEQAVKIYEEKLPQELRNMAKEIMNSWVEKIEFHKKTCELIKNLKHDGYKVYGLSNASIQFYEYIKNTDILKYFDGVIISGIEKVIKPNEEIYHRLFNKFSLNPQECFFIDDREENIIASEKCGMKGFVFNIDEFEKLEKELENLS